MKHYPKVYEDIYPLTPNLRVERIGSSYGTVEELSSLFREFYKDAHRGIFNMVVRQVWLESQVTYGGKRRKKRGANGFSSDWTFGFFMKNMVGISQKPITSNFCFTALSTYLLDLFPHFDKYNPFTQPERYQYPYRHISIDHMVFVYNCDDRLEMLAYAEKRQMKFAEFANWAVNQALCYNDSVGKTVYTLSSAMRMWPYLKKVNRPYRWGAKPKRL